MATTRRRFTAEFKARVVMEALRGDRTMLPASAGFHNPPTSISAARQAMMPE